jgi:uncharacterized protein
MAAGACLLAVVVVLAGCAASEPARFYTLSPRAADAAGAEPAASVRKAGGNIALSPVELPRYLDRPQLVTRRDATTLDLAEFDKWAEPLADMIGRTLAEDLAHRLPADRIFLLPVRQAVPIDRVVDVQIMRFDADAKGEVTLDARWQVFGDGSRTLLAARNTVVQEAADGTGKAAIVAAMSRALSRLSADIAEVLRGKDAPKDPRRA